MAASQACKTKFFLRKHFAFNPFNLPKIFHFMCLTGSAFTFAMTIIIIIIFFWREGGWKIIWDPGPGPWYLWPLDTVPCQSELWNWDPGTWDLDTQDPGTGSLELGICYPETQNPESRTMRIELITQIPSIPTRTPGCTKFNYEA